MKTTAMQAGPTESLVLTDRAKEALFLLAFEYGRLRALKEAAGRGQGDSSRTVCHGLPNTEAMDKDFNSGNK